MAISLKHPFVSSKSDGVDTTLVQPSNWNAEHVLTAAAGKVLGTLVGSTTVSELPLEVDATGQALRIPQGATGARPGTGLAGMLRFNSTTGTYEGHNGSAWGSLAAAAPPNIGLARTISSASTVGERTLTVADAGKLIIFSGTTDFTVTFDAVATLGNGWTCFLKHSSRCLVTLDPNGSETIDGVTTLPVLYKQQGTLICTGSAIETFSIQRQVLLESWALTSNVSEIAFLLPNGYDRFILRFDYTPSTTGDLLMQLSSNGGTSYASTGYSGAFLLGTSGGSVVSGSMPATALKLSYFTDTVPACGFAEITRGTASYGWKVNSVYGYYGTTSGFVNQSNLSIYGAAITANAARLYASSGTLQSGSKFALWGVQQ